MVVGNLDLPLDAISVLCRKYQVKELALFGSALRPDFRSDSDIDLLVEFRPEAKTSLFEFCALRNQLADLLAKPVDLVTRSGLKPRIKREILAQSKVVYAA